ncbi:MAG: hypothetical protein K8F52_07100 [Candidatus Scalindua rubra]|nr:hypothetical protein [Candidatus Scalindua rubra]TWU31892.1 hypothetical protein S225a_19750 [Candidatus Brocadiaceae bacterium S225]
MSIFKEVLDGLDAVAKAIENVKKIREAISEGKGYIDVKHPDVKSDLGLLLNEFRKTINGVAQASSVLTNFRFAISADAGASELRAFNDYFIKHKGEAQFLEDHLEDLRGHCSKIREHALRITDSATASGFAGLFRMLGFNSPQRELELGKMLDRLAYEDFEDANSLQIMVGCLKMALTDVQNALGDQGAMYPENVPKAAKLLAEYAARFEKLEKTTSSTEDELKKVIDDLR